MNTDYEYIEQLRKHSELSKKEGFQKDPEWIRLQENLTEKERAMTAREIVRHTQLAFPAAVTN